MAKKKKKKTVEQERDAQTWYQIADQHQLRISSSQFRNQGQWES